MTRKIVGLCVAKNEADIIESMVRHNLQYLDAIHVVDNDSADGTQAIMSSLAEEFPDRVSWASDERTGHRQTEIINQTLPALVSSSNAWHVVLLDADECLRGEPSQVSDALRISETPILLPWMTYVPSPSDDPSVLSPIARISHRRRRESPQYFKTTVPAPLIAHVEVTPGSHALKGEAAGIATQVDGVTLAHFPVRTREQLISKILIGAWNLRLRADRMQREGYHWLRLAERILSGEPVTDVELQSVALGYAARKEVRLVHDPLLPTVPTLKYTPVHRDRLWINLAAFTERCVQMLEADNEQFSRRGERGN